MACQSCLRRFRALTTIVTLVTLGMGLTIDSAGAGRARPSSNSSQSTISGAPVVAIVSINTQRVSLFDAYGGVVRARVSTGRTGYETPVGIYSVLAKEEEHYSNVYDDAAMPFMQRITWSGLALHAGVLPGYPASHGCVRLPEKFAEQIFPLTKIGMRVIVAHDDVTPIEIFHPLLLKVLSTPSAESDLALPTAYREIDGNHVSPIEPDLRNWPARETQFEALKAIVAEKFAKADAAAVRADSLRRTAAASFARRGKAAKILRVAAFAKRVAEGKVAQAEREIAATKSTSAIKNWEVVKLEAAAAISDAEVKIVSSTIKLMIAHEEFERANEEVALADTKRAAAVSAAKEAERQTLPISIFISLKTQHLYVRQGYEPVFDAPVNISDPTKAIGTHIYTAVDYLNHGRDLRWTAVSLLRRTSEKKHHGGGSNEARPSDGGLASAALNRITLPPEVVARLSGQVWPRSSLIVSDEEISKETGKGTDFIVLISGEPQGGLRKRPRQVPTRYFYRYDANDSDGDDRYLSRRYRRVDSFNW